MGVKFRKRRHDLASAVESLCGFNEESATNRTAIQEVITQGTENSVMEIEPGTIPLSGIESLAAAISNGTLYIPSNRKYTIRGSGMEHTILHFDDSLTNTVTQQFYDIKVNQGATLYLEDMTIVGPDINQAAEANPFVGTTVVNNWLVYAFGKSKVISRNVKFIGGNITFKTDWEYTVTYSAWATNTLYYPGDRVTNGGNIYECWFGGTSEAGYAPTGTGGAGLPGASSGYLSWSYVGTTASFSEPPILEFYNCYIGGRANFLGGVASAGQDNTNYNNAGSWMKFVDCVLEKDRDSMYLNQGTSCGHNIYIDPGYNVSLRGCRVLRTGSEGATALHFTDSVGDNRINTECIVDSCYFGPLSGGLLLTQYAAAVISNCAFNYGLAAISAFGGGNRSQLQIHSCTFSNYQIGGVAIQDIGTSTCDMEVVGSSFCSRKIASGGGAGFMSYIDRNTSGQSSNSMWRFSNCKFGGDATKDDAVLSVSSSATKDQHRNEFINCTFGAHGQYFTIRANSGHYLFRDVKMYGDKDLSFFDNDMYSNSNWAVQNIVVHCERLDLSEVTSATGGLKVVNPDTKTFTITGTIKWGTNAPSIGALASITGYLGFYPGIGANKASAASITFDGNYDTYHVTGTTTVDNIYILSATATRIFKGPLYIIADGAFAFSAAGNILPKSLAARTATEMYAFVYDTVAGKWREI